MERTPAATTAPDDKLRHLPPAAQTAYHRFQATRATADLDVVIFAILADFIPQKTGQPLAALPGQTRLMEDLGYDSLAITELIFFTEELFGITISNEEILEARTLDELRHFIHRKVTAAAAG